MVRKRTLFFFLFSLVSEITPFFFFHFTPKTQVAKGAVNRFRSPRHQKRNNFEILFEKILGKMKYKKIK